MTLEELSRSICRSLRQFDAEQAGSLPIGLSVPGSDVDIICCFSDQATFIEHVTRQFSHMEGYSVKCINSKGSECVVCRFVDAGINIEVFGQKTPVRLQYAWKHRVVEERLLRLGGADFKGKVMAFRLTGMKTEQAFAAALQHDGDIKALLLSLFDASDQELVSLITRAEVK